MSTHSLFVITILHLLAFSICTVTSVEGKCPEDSPVFYSSDEVNAATSQL